MSIDAEDGPFELTVKVEGINHHFVDRGEPSDGLGVFQFALVFDPEIVTVTDVEPGPFLGSTGRSTSCFSELRPNEPGIFDFACISQSPPASGPQGGGTLATLTLYPLRSGQSDLVLEGELGGPLGSTGDDIAFKAFGGRVTVRGTPSVTPPRPTPRPGRQVTPNPDGSIPGIDGSGGNQPGQVSGPVASQTPGDRSGGQATGQSPDELSVAGSGPLTGRDGPWPLTAAGLLAAAGAALLLPAGVRFVSRGSQR